MTILTATGSEKPKEAQVLINPETMVKVEFKQSQRDVAARKQQRKAQAAINDLINTRSRRRRHMAMNIVVAIASLLVVVTGIFGGMYIYKWISYSNKLSAQGSCPVRYHEEMRIDGYAQAQVQPSSSKPNRRGHGPMPDEGRRRPETGPHSRRPQQPQNRGYGGQFVEKYSILNPEQETLQVPQLGLSAYSMFPITVVHDFNAKLTAIADLFGGRCFIKALDPEVVPPRDFLDLLRRVEDGSYVPNVCLIRKHYRAVTPPLDVIGMSSLRSDIIARTCSGLASYKIVRIDTPVSIPPTTTRRMLIGAGTEDFNIQVEQDDSEDPPVVLGGKTDPDNANFPGSRRAKREVQDMVDESSVNQEVPIDLELEAPSSVVRKGQRGDWDATADSDAENEVNDGEIVEAGGDADDVAVNLGYAGSENVEVALIHFDQEEDGEAV